MVRYLNYLKRVTACCVVSLAFNSNEYCVTYSSQCCTFNWENFEFDFAFSNEDRSKRKLLLFPHFIYFSHFYTSSSEFYTEKKNLVLLNDMIREVVDFE